MPRGRRDQARRTVPRVTELALQRVDARGRDFSPPARDQTNRPVERLNGSPETPDHERPTLRAGGAGNEVADVLPATTDRDRKRLIRARRGNAAPARAGDAGEACRRRRDASTRYARVIGARIAVVALRCVVTCCAR